MTTRASPCRCLVAAARSCSAADLQIIQGYKVPRYGDPPGVASPRYTGAAVRPIHALARARVPPFGFHTFDRRFAAAPAPPVAPLPILISSLVIIRAADCRRRERPQGPHGRRFMSLMEKLRLAQAEISEAQADPWKRVLERGVPANVSSISSVALLDLLGFGPTTGNCRRLALTMRSLGWVALKSRRLVPGGWRTTTCRGWARPVREPRVRQPCGPVKRYHHERVER